jgi:hypothetical protein
LAATGATFGLAAGLVSEALSAEGNKPGDGQPAGKRENPEPKSHDNKPSRPEADAAESELSASEAAIVDEAYRLGHEYEKKHGGCCQCTVAALQDALPFLPRDGKLIQAASALSGGATPGGVQNCGSFTGGGMVIGFLYGRQRDETFHGSTGKAHRLIRRLYQHYEEHYGTVLCKDVRKGAESDCPEVVGLAATWTAEILLRERRNERAKSQDRG